MRKAPPLGITMGDPAGIGPEIVVRAHARGQAANCVVIGDPSVMSRACGHSGIPLEVIDGPAAMKEGALNVIAASTVDATIAPGRVSAEAGEIAYAAIREGISLARAGAIAGLVTAPIHKESLSAAGVPFPGHTEMLDAFGFGEATGRTEAERVAMMLVNDELRIVLVTIHCSLREAIERVDAESVGRAIRLAESGTRALGVARPRVAVAGLNPHAGEGGLFGDEDRRIIAPAIAAARADGIDASGPWPGDTVFMQARQGRFDVVVAQYHDQGLIPIKYLGIDEGVNITLGLPFVRTSPDHGTAFDIVGTGKASERSLVRAIEVARILAEQGGAQASGEPVAR